MTYHFSLQIGPLRVKKTVLENRYFSIILVIVLLNNAVIYVGGNVTNNYRAKSIGQNVIHIENMRCISLIFSIALDNVICVLFVRAQGPDYTHIVSSSCTLVHSSISSMQAGNYMQSLWFKNPPFGLFLFSLWSPYFLRSIIMPMPMQVLQ